MKLSTKAKRERAKKREAAKLAAIKKHRQHITVGVMLAGAIITVRVFMPDAIHVAADEVKTVTQVVTNMAKDSGTALLALTGLGYILKELWKAFKS